MNNYLLNNLARNTSFYHIKNYTKHTATTMDSLVLQPNYQKTIIPEQQITCHAQGMRNFRVQNHKEDTSTNNMKISINLNIGMHYDLTDQNTKKIGTVKAAKTEAVI